MTFYFRNMQWFESRTTNFQCSARGHSLGRCSDLWSGLSDHDLSICRHSPFNVLPHIDSSRSNSATLGRRFSFRYRWIYLLEKSIETLLFWNQEPIGILQQRWKFLNFCRQGLAYRPLPALGRWNSFRFACAVAGNRKIGGFLWCRISKFRAWFPTSKTTRWRPGAYKQILPKMDEMFWSLTKRKTYIHLFFIFPTCHRFHNARFNNSNPWSITFFPTHIQGPGLPIWKSFSNSCDRNCTSKNSGSCVGGKPSRNGHRNKRTLCLHDRDDLHAKK